MYNTYNFLDSMTINCNLLLCQTNTVCWILLNYRGADKFLARPGRKQATATEDFDVHISYLLS